MTVILCVDNRGGLLFNNRRLSRDSVLIDDIIQYTSGSTLRMDEYSAKLFEGKDAAPIVSEDFLSQAGQDDFCFVERSPTGGHADSVNGYIIYCWNRDYPADVVFDSGLLDDFILLDEREFAGSSHEKITARVYGRCEHELL